MSPTSSRTRSSRNPKRRILVRRLLTDILRLWTLVLIGAIGFMIVERWSFLDALFMTVITLTTVGYGEVHELSDGGKIYAIILILGGAGVVLYILSDMVELFLNFNFRLRRMKERISRLSGHYVICGWGRTGQEVTEHFQLKGLPFVILETDQQRARRAEEEGHLVILGDATTDETLEEAQIGKAKGIICALPDDAANTFIALTAKELNESIVIVSRAANPGSESKLRRAGAAMVISPYVICGRRMATAVTHPLVTEFLDVVMHTPDYDLRMEQVIVGQKCKLVGSTLRDANIKQQSGAMILAVNQNGKLMTNPLPDLVFHGGDELIALGTEEELKRLAALAGAPTD